MTKLKNKSLEQLNEELQAQLILEDKQRYEQQKKEARLKSEFKVGDIVRGEVQGKIQALEIVDVISCEHYSEPDGDYFCTHYEVKAVYGRVFNKLVISGGTHPDCRDDLSIIQRAK